jgi:hypothetical protein
VFNILGGEPLYQPELEQCLELFEQYPAPELKLQMFTNLKDQNGSAIALNATINPELTGSNGYMFDSFYNSTQYGALHVMDRWVTT